MGKSSWESKISGWQADWRPATEQLSRHADELTSLVGTRLTGAWSIWTGEGIDDWFADMPVVLEFDGRRRLEVCWQKFDDLSISWNTIDLELPPRAWVDESAWYQWRHVAFSANQGATVTEVAGTTFPWTTMDVDYPHRKPSTIRLTGGLWIGTTGPGLHIFNALDENGLAEGHHEPDERLSLAEIKALP